MKTAMQEHIEWLKATIEIAEEQAPILVSSLKLCLGDAIQKLELEKQQIIDCFMDVSTQLLTITGELSEKQSKRLKEAAEQYYNETFKSE